MFFFVWLVGFYPLVTCKFVQLLQNVTPVQSTKKKKKDIISEEPSKDF